MFEPAGFAFVERLLMISFTERIILDPYSENNFGHSKNMFFLPVERNNWLLLHSSVPTLCQNCIRQTKSRSKIQMILRNRLENWIIVEQMAICSWNRVI